MKTWKDFISQSAIGDLALRYGTPLYVYRAELLSQRIQQLKDLHLPFGCTIRYAIKANPHSGIIQIIERAGLHFDASSSYEAAALLKQGIPGEKISLSSQQPAHNLSQLIDSHVRLTATSLHQLHLYAEASPKGTSIGLRVNPGIGSGHNNRTTTGGLTSSFGLWYECLDQALAIANTQNVTIGTLHVHIGSGADPSAWGETMDQALTIAKQMPDVTVINIGGGYKIQRVAGEVETDMAAVAAVFTEKLVAFANKTSRQLHLEIEPGTWLVAHAGILVAEVVDIVDTGTHGFAFLRTNTGMNDFMRPTLYGAQHEIEVINKATEYTEYVIVGHNCETGDILTPAPKDPEHIMPRTLRRASIGDSIVIFDTGAYGSTLSARGYNAFPSAKEVIIN